MQCATLIHPELYNTGVAAIHQLQMGSILHSTQPNINLWPTFSGIQVIVNRDTGIWGAALPITTSC